VLRFPVEIPSAEHRRIATSAGQLLYTSSYHDRFMVKKSDSFFIRQTLNADNTNAYQQIPLDLGAYVDALGKSVLRIHNIAVSFTDADGKSLEIGTQTSGSAMFQLCTQSQTDMVFSSNRAVISSGKILGVNTLTGDHYPNISHDSDVLPQMWTNGYLVAVDAIYLGGQASTTWTTDVYVSVTLECTVETMSEASAMALALSQQGA